MRIVIGFVSTLFGFIWLFVVLREMAEAIIAVRPLGTIFGLSAGASSVFFALAVTLFASKGEKW